MNKKVLLPDGLKSAITQTYSQKLFANSLRVLTLCVAIGIMFLFNVKDLNATTLQFKCDPSCIETLLAQESINMTTTSVRGIDTLSVTITPGGNGLLGLKMEVVVKVTVFGWTIQKKMTVYLAVPEPDGGGGVDWETVDEDPNLDIRWGDATAYDLGVGGEILLQVPVYDTTNNLVGQIVNSEYYEEFPDAIAYMVLAGSEETMTPDFQASVYPNPTNASTFVQLTNHWMYNITAITYKLYRNNTSLTLIQTFIPNNPGSVVEIPQQLIAQSGNYMVVCEITYLNPYYQNQSKTETIVLPFIKN